MLSEVYKCGFRCSCQTFYLILRGGGIQITKPTRTEILDTLLHSTGTFSHRRVLMWWGATNVMWNYFLRSMCTLPTVTIFKEFVLIFLSSTNAMKKPKPTMCYSVSKYFDSPALCVGHSLLWETPIFKNGLQIYSFIFF